MSDFEKAMNETTDDMTLKQYADDMEREVLSDRVKQYAEILDNLEAQISELTEDLNRTKLASDALVCALNVLDSHVQVGRAPAPARGSGMQPNSVEQSWTAASEKRDKEISDAAVADFPDL